MKNVICTAIIVAAGRGKRMGTQRSKQFLPLGGKEILAHTMARFEETAAIRDILLVTSADAMEDVREMAQKYGWRKLSAVVEGGAERQDSVWNGLQRLSADTEIVLIHDAVRPFVTEDILLRSIETAQEVGCCIAGVPAKDTIKVCDGDGMVAATPARESLWQIQTPQTFRKDLILRAYERAMREGFSGTDDASLAEHAGYAVKVILGDYRNIKITTPEDLRIAELFFQEGQVKQTEPPVKKSAEKSKNQQEKTVIIYTDGACSGNPGAGGYGVVLLYGAQRRELSEGYRRTTNNRMELLAVIKGLEALKAPCRVELYSDSKYVVDAIEKGWVSKWAQNGWMRNNKERASNVDLWERLLPLLAKHRVSFRWVKGHADNPENEHCDALARAAAQGDALKNDEMYGLL